MCRLYFFINKERFDYVEYRKNLIKICTIAFGLNFKPGSKIIRYKSMRVDALRAISALYPD